MNRTNAPGDSMKKEVKLSFLKKIELFNELSDEELEQIADLMDVAQYEPNQLIFRENTQRKYMYLIYQGEIELFKKTATGK